MSNTHHTSRYWGEGPDPSVGLHAVRKGDWKMHWWREGSHCSTRYPDPWCYERLTKLPEPLLYNLAVDVGELYNLSLTAYVSALLLRDYTVLGLT